MPHVKIVIKVPYEPDPKNYPEGVTTVQQMFEQDFIPDEELEAGSWIEWVMDTDWIGYDVELVMDDEGEDASG